MKKIGFYFLVLAALFVFSGCGRPEAEVKPAPVSVKNLKPGLVVGGQAKPKEAATGAQGEAAVVSLANPASVLCKKLGYELKIEASDAGESGFCLFPDGSRCDEWQFFRGECGAEKRQISLSAVSSHASESDCWQAIEGKVYDLSAFVASHPGGKAIVSGCGLDASELFNKKPGTGKDHSVKAGEMLKDYYLAELAK